MDHKEYKRINDSARIAVLFIHGILGTPNHFDKFVELVPSSLSVCNMLLDGHGHGVSEFSCASMSAWENQVSSTVDELSARHDEIYIVAHSMGTLLAIEQALKNTKISKLFLLAVPLRLSLKFKMISSSVKVYTDRIKPDDYEGLEAKRCCGIKHSKNIFKYIGWIPRFFDLFAKIKKTGPMIALLNTDCAAYQSDKDEMVSLKSAKSLSSNPRIRVFRLENSSHYYYDEHDLDFLLNEFIKMIKGDMPKDIYQNIDF